VTPDLCPHCGQMIPNSKRAELTAGELDAVSAWWHTGSVKRAADLLSRAERTVVNQLYSARIRNNVHTTVELAQMYFGELRSVSELMAQHKVRGKEAA
jgi:DNA-binding CsgD family transcriptional regulator